MAYVLGFFCADGTITVNHRGSEYIAIQIVDKKLLEGIRKSLDSNHKIATRIRPKEKNVIYRLQIGSKEMCNDLRALGAVEQKTYRLVLPDVPTRYIGHFVRGYFDGDGNVWTGYVHKERKKHFYTIQTSFTSCSKGVLSNLKDKLEEINIKGSLFKRRYKDIYRLQYSVKGSILLYQLMYDELKSYLYLERKKKVYDKFVRKTQYAAVV